MRVRRYRTVCQLTEESDEIAAARSVLVLRSRTKRKCRPAVPRALRFVRRMNITFSGNPTALGREMSGLVNCCG